MRERLTILVIVETRTDEHSVSYIAYVKFYNILVD